jgi:hypothetical protein
VATPLPPSASAIRVPSVHRREWRILAVIGLVVVGLALIGYGAVLWLSGGSAGPSTVRKVSTTSVDKPANADTEGGTTTTRVDTTDTKTPGEPAERSEAVVAALLGLGSVLFLCGVFFGRIQEVTLPGGAALKLAPEAQEKLVEKVTAAASAAPDLSPDDPQTMLRLYQQSLDELLRELPAVAPEPVVMESPGGGYHVGTVRTEVSPPDDYLDRAVARATEQMTS